MPELVRFTYIIETVVLRVFEHKTKHHVSGSGGDAIFADVSEGWFIALRGSYEALHVGDTPPVMKPGDKVKITVEKIG